MNYSDYHISLLDYDHYRARERSESIDRIWSDIINRIEDPKLSKEAHEKGYIIVDNPDIEDDVIANYMMFQIPNASRELMSYIEENLYPYLVLMKEEEEEYS